MHKYLHPVEIYSMNISISGLFHVHFSDEENFLIYTYERTCHYQVNIELLKSITRHALNVINCRLLKNVFPEKGVTKEQ